MDVRRCYVKIKQIFPYAPNILAAHIIKNIDGYQENHEHGALVKMLKEMQDQSVANLCIYIVHEHAGIHIGPKCHIIIQKVLCEAITKAT